MILGIRYNAMWNLMHTTGFPWGADTLDIRVLLLKHNADLVLDQAHASVGAILAEENNAECDDATYTAKGDDGRISVPHAERSIETVAEDGDTGQHIFRYKLAEPVDYGDLDNELVGIALFYVHVGADDANNIPVYATRIGTGSGRQTNGAGFEVAPDEDDVLFDTLNALLTDD